MTRKDTTLPIVENTDFNLDYHSTRTAPFENLLTKEKFLDETA